MFHWNEAFVMRMDHARNLKDSIVMKLTNEDLNAIEGDFDFTKRRKIEETNSNNNNNNLIGVKRGESSFEVDDLKRKRRLEKVPREDGREWPKDFEGEGGYYEEPWRDEAEENRRILEKDPNYQFLILVAGASNVVVEQLYEEGDIQAVFRRGQALLRQQRLALEEVKATTRDVERDVANLTAELQDLRMRRNRMLNTEIEADRLFRELGSSEKMYEEERDSERKDKMKSVILGVYRDTQNVRTDDALIFVEKELIDSAQSLIDEGKDEGLFDFLSDMKSLPENERPYSELIQKLFDLWKEIDDPDGEQSDDDYLEDQIATIIPALIVDSEDKMGQHMEQILRKSYDAFFFFEENNILATNPGDLYEESDRGSRRGYSSDRALDLYKKYGGILLRTTDDPIVNVQDYYTNAYIRIKKEIDELSKTDPEIKKRLQKPLYAGPYTTTLDYFLQWSNLLIIDIRQDIEKVGDQLEASRERLSRLRRGEVKFEDLEQPYRHRRQWVERPENSGVVRMKPIVVNGIDHAFKWVQIWTPYGMNVDVEFMQRDPEIRGDFARLVAIKMSFAVMSFPKQYLSQSLRKFAKQDEYQTGHRLKTGYSVSKQYDRGILEYKAKPLTGTRSARDIFLQDRRDSLIMFN